MTTQTIPVQLKRQDFVSDQTVRWCPGCGDYAILAQIQKTLPDIGYAKEDIVFISGIGCSSRFPYYMNTYGIHSIHGRAPTIATGLVISNPDLSVWVVTGDGDGLSIGGNHLVHALRRNVNLNITLFNNRIYGLTKGQYSPTSRQGTKTKSSPMGSIERPLNPIAVALAAEATFVARTLDAQTSHMGETLATAAAHKGGSFIEIFQNCIIFNPTEWDALGDRRTRDEHVLYLKHGQPMVFGKNRDKGIRLNGFKPEVVELGNGVSEADLMVHDVTSKHLAYILASMEFPEYPAPLGVIYQVDKPIYTDVLMSQVKSAQQTRGTGDLNALYRSADLWEVTAPSEDNMPKQTGELSLALDDEYMDTLSQAPSVTTAEQDLLTDTSIADLQPNTPIVVDLFTSLEKVVRQMKSHRIGCLLVTDENDKLVGIFTERDLVMRVAGMVTDLSETVVSDYMTPNPVAMKGYLPLAHALHLMSVNGFRHLPLVDEDGHPEGIISFRDVIHYLKEQYTE